MSYKIKPGEIRYGELRVAVMKPGPFIDQLHILRIDDCILSANECMETICKAMAARYIKEDKETYSMIRLGSVLDFTLMIESKMGKNGNEVSVKSLTVHVSY